MVYDDEFFIKTVQRIKDGVRLKSENQEFDNIEIFGDDLNKLNIIGQKVWRGG